MRTSSRGVGKIVRISLAQVDERWRRLVSRRLREQRWEHELRPDRHYSPDMKTRVRALVDAALIEGAAVRPSARRYYVLEEMADDVIEKHGA